MTGVKIADFYVSLQIWILPLTACPFSMKAYNLGFISDEDIYGHVQDTVRLYRRSINLSEFNENIADPIKLTFDAKVYRKSMEQVISEECFRQIDKSNTNRIGYFISSFSTMPGMAGLFQRLASMWKTMRGISSWR